MLFPMFSEKMEAERLNGESVQNKDELSSQLSDSQDVTSFSMHEKMGSEEHEDETDLPHHLGRLQDEETSVVRKRNFDGAASELEDDLACSVCLLLAVQPTTLVCGHTSCRGCLARWYFTAHTKTCPMCRQQYHGLPRTNIQIRNMIHKLYPVKARVREEELEADEDSMSIVAKYDKELQEEPSEKTETDMASFCAGIIIAICCFIVMYLAWYWQSSDTNLLVLKPVQTWKPKDVSQWVKELSWADVYSETAIDKHVDGNMLLSISEKDLEPVFNMTDPVHQRAFLFAIELLREEGIKMPANLWEYKAIYPGRSLFLAFSMKDFPRTSLLYMYVYFYDDMFLPFVRATTGANNNEPQQTHTQGDDISRSQWVSFLVYTLLVPEWLVIVFAVQMFAHHFFSPMFVIATAVLYQTMEYLAWISLSRNLTARSVYHFFRQHAKQLMSAFMFMVLWPIVPHLICDVFFYGALYISPVQGSMAVYNKFTVLNNP